MLRKAGYQGALIAVLAMTLASPVYSASESECAARADRAARDSTTMLGGAVVGAAGGAAVGAIVGGKSKYTKRGAAIGAVTGGATQAYRKNERYKQVYDDCMRGR